jgi:RimJ/RimL family protein N-acetyltransferase
MCSLLELPRGIEVGVLSRDKILSLWDKVKNYSPMFDDASRWNLEWFALRMYLRDTVLLENDGGIMLLTDTKPKHFAACHLTYWDKSLSKRTELIKEAIRWAFLQFDLQRLETHLPEYARAVRRFVEKRLGFKCEGRLRKRVMYKDNPADLLLYALLREEVL